jgi:hypothetical protein
MKLTPQLLAEKYNLTPFNVSDPVDGDITLSVVMWSDVYFLLCGIEYEVEATRPNFAAWEGTVTYLEGIEEVIVRDEYGEIDRYKSGYELGKVHGKARGVREALDAV